MKMHQHLDQSLVKMESLDSQTLNVEFSFPESLSLFEGHFPHYSLLPGIVQIELVRFSLSRHLECHLSISQVTQAKFKTQVPPEKTVTLEVHYEEEGDELKVKGELDTDEGKVSSIALLLKR